MWTTALPDWEKRIVAGESLIGFEPLFPEQAKLALAVFDELRMVDVLNSPRLGDISKPWIRDFAAQIFGSYNPATGERLIQDYYLLIPKKNGKSSIAAGIMLTALILNWRKSAEFIIISPTVEIAKNSFKPAADMVRADPELSDLFQVQDHIRTITHRITGATLKVVAADSNTVGGKKAVGVLVDEHWLFGKQSNAEDMFREALGGLASRPEGFVIYLTTQSNEPPAGVFKAKLEYARKVRDGVIDDPRFLPVLYEFPKSYIKSKKYLAPESMYIVNPNLIDPARPELGGSVSASYLQREFKMAQDTSEETVRGFLAKHFNIEVGLALANDNWAGAEYWLNAKTPSKITLSEMLDQCEVVVAGIDGGGLDDLLGLNLLGRTKEGKWLSWSHAWAHPSVLTRRKEIAPRLRDFAAAKEMTLVTAIGEDTEQLAAIVAQIHNSGLLHEIGLDPNAIGGVLDALVEVGIPEEMMLSVNQGYRLAGAIKTTERKLAEGVLVHDGSKLMNWCVGNAKVKVVGNAIVVTKQVSGTAKIDPLMALFNSVQLMSANPPALAGHYDFDRVIIG